MPLLPWWVVPLAKGLGILAAGFFIYQAIDNNWATDAGIAEGKRRAIAEVQPQLDACRVQELAVSDLVKEGEERRARAADGLKKASTAVKAARTEAERLKTLAKPENAPRASQECPAGRAVQEIRRGLL